MYIQHFIIAIALAVSLFSHSINVSAEIIAGEAVSFEISRDGLQSKMEQLATKPGVDLDSKAREMNWYQLADENIADQQWFSYLSSSYQGFLETAPDKLKTEIQNIINKENKALFNPQQDYSIEELNILILNTKGELRALNNKISKLESELNKLTLRPQQMREETLAAKQRLKQAKSDSNIARLPTENKYEYQAQQIYLHTLINALTAEFKKLELESASNPLKVQLNKRSLEEIGGQKNICRAFLSSKKLYLRNSDILIQTKLI